MSSLFIIIQLIILLLKFQFGTSLAFYLFSVTVKLEDIKSAEVEHQGEGDGEAKQVVLCMHNGVHLGITEVFTTDDLQ